MFDEKNYNLNNEADNQTDGSGFDNTQAENLSATPTECGNPVENTENTENFENIQSAQADIQSEDDFSIDLKNVEQQANVANEPVMQQPIHVTEERPAVAFNPYRQSAVVNQQESGIPFDGVAYTKNVNGESMNGYEWNNTQSTAAPKKKKESTGRGFKVFIASILTVFTASVITLTAMVVYQLVSDGRIGVELDTSYGKHSDSSTGIPTYGNSTASSSNEGVAASTSNYVVYDSTERSGEILTIPQIAAKCSPSSVGIVSEVEVSYSYPFGFGSSTGVSEASGSGFIYSSDGYVITNHHVIEDAKKVTVILHDGTEFEAEIIGSDSLSDIAVLKITPDEGTTLVPMEIGNSDELVVGESVVAIGCPAGIEFIGTVTDGIISAINRNVEINDSYGTTQKTMTLIQTNATINHGNSGGPLINSRGQVIGINTLKLSSSSYEGIGFSIPMNGAMPIIKQLIEHGKVIERTQDDFAYGKGVIGISGTAISEDEAKYYNIPMGVLVVQIDKNSSAAKAGLRRGDIITHYNGKEVATVQDINEAKGSSRAGEKVTVTVYRDSATGFGDGETVEITFALDTQK